MLVVKDPSAALYETPPSLIVAGRGCWLSAQGSAAMLPPSEAQLDVQRALGALRVPFAAGVMGDDGLFPLKLAITERCGAPRACLLNLHTCFTCPRACGCCGGLPPPCCACVAHPTPPAAHGMLIHQHRPRQAHRH